ncbi:hypothetical protein CVT25_009001 [Psilocybe cyanescens]|uniref:Secreted protein n=1 Tax=Psilocybe cyanescens TaxID=93625 RepID=A0A409XNC9_PSICY|nr:hypothetical protein CVT25_009001 [Psilocybe cyanescens]
MRHRTSVLSLAFVLVLQSGRFPLSATFTPVQARKLALAIPRIFRIIPTTSQLSSNIFVLVVIWEELEPGFSFPAQHWHCLFFVEVEHGGEGLTSCSG